MKRFEELFLELSEKVEKRDQASRTVVEVAAGKDFIAKKILEEAGEVWVASRCENRDRVAEEISQLLYHTQVMMIACGLELEDVYKYL